MSDCPVPQDLCGLVRGDTWLFPVTFKDSAGDPMNISGMTLFFTLKVDKSQETPDLQVTHLFPDDANSQAGTGKMKVLPVDTDMVEGDTNYWYDFQLVNGPEDVFTVGAGTAYIEQDVTLVTT